MEIQGFSLFPGSSIRATGNVSPSGQNDSSSPPVTGESFQKENKVLPPRLMKHFGQILISRGINKSSAEYRMSTCFPSADGTLYLSYMGPEKDMSKGSTGYMAAVSPDGTILWERALEHEGHVEVNAGKDGTVYIRSKSHLTALNADGTKKFDHEFESPVYGKQIIDSKGNSYFLDGNIGELYRIDARGNRAALPQGLRERPMMPVMVNNRLLEECVQAGPDDVWARNGNYFIHYDLDRGEIREKFEFTPPVNETGNTVRLVTGFTTDPKGNLNIYMKHLPAMKGWAMDMMTSSPGGKSMTSPQLSPRMSPHSSLISIGGVAVGMGIFDKPCIAKVDAGGNVLASSDFWGTINASAELGDGTFVYLFEKEKARESASNGISLFLPATLDTFPEKPVIFLGKIGPDGKRSDSFVKMDEGVGVILPAPEGDSFYIHSGINRLSQFTSRGKPLKSVNVPGDGSTYIPIDSLPGGRIVMTRLEKGDAFIFDMNTGALTPLTDHEKDHSSTVVSREMERLKEQKPEDMSITQFEEILDFGGVRLDRNKR